MNRHRNLLRLNPPNTLLSLSAGAARSLACGPRWGTLVTASTTPWPKASSRLWNAKCWIEITSTLERQHAGLSLVGSNAGIILIAGTPPSVTFHHGSSKDASRKHH